MTQTAQLIQDLGALSYLGIFGVSLLANVIIPVPEEVVLLGFGYVAGRAGFDPLTLVLLVMGGLFVSDMLMYYLSKKGSKIVTFFYNKMFAKRLADKKVWLESHIEKVIFFSRFMVQLRFLGPFLAGQSNVPVGKFIKYELLALLVYVPLYIWAGWYFQNRIEGIISGINMVKNAFLIVIGISILIYLSRFIYKQVFSNTA